MLLFQKKKKMSAHLINQKQLLCLHPTLICISFKHKQDPAFQISTGKHGKHLWTSVSWKYLPNSPQGCYKSKLVSNMRLDLSIKAASEVILKILTSNFNNPPDQLKSSWRIFPSIVNFNYVHFLLILLFGNFQS